MPPSGHSSSSHSSHSSSSHSSSFGSSRSYSSGSSRSSSGPSSHSSSSWSSKPSYSSKPSRPKAPAPARPRVNQPAGYRTFGGVRPTYYYGRRHDYIYYPVAWTDSGSGRSYKAGYYDENGQYYDNVSFNTDGKYKNVVCHCSYCDRDAIVDLSAEDAASKSLQCPNCGAPMAVSSFLDDYIADNQASADREARAAKRSDRRRIGCLVALVIFLAIGIISCVAAEMADNSPGAGTGTQQVYTLEGSSNVDMFGETVQLTAGKNGAYTIDGGAAADKMLIWDTDADSYYDQSSDCWVWYNTDVEPPVWQYWYEGISSDFGDYGWMEHDETGWYIEKSSGNWVKLPDKYDASSLWYIDG